MALLSLPIRGGLLLCACFLGVPSVAVAAKPLVVMLSAPERPMAERALHEAVSAQLSDVGVRLVVERRQGATTGRCRLAQARAVARRAGVALVFWYDTQSRRLCLLHGKRYGGALVSRSVGEGGAVAQRETAAVVVRQSAKRAVSPGERSPPPRRQPGPKRSAPAAAAKTTRHWLSLELGYAVDVVTHQDPVVAHGLRLALLLRLHRRWSVFVGYRLEARLALDEEAIDLARYPLDAGARFRWRRGLLELGAQANLGFAYTSLLQRQPASSANAVKASQEWLVFAGVAGYAALRPTDRLAFHLTLGVRFYILSSEYRSDDGDFRWVPWRVQPGATLGMTVVLY